MEYIKFINMDNGKSVKNVINKKEIKNFENLQVHDTIIIDGYIYIIKYRIIHTERKEIYYAVRKTDNMDRILDRCKIM